MIIHCIIIIILIYDYLFISLSFYRYFVSHMHARSCLPFVSSMVGFRARTLHRLAIRPIQPIKRHLMTLVYDIRRHRNEYSASYNATVVHHVSSPARPTVVAADHPSAAADQQTSSATKHSFERDRPSRSFPRTSVVP